MAARRTLLFMGLKGAPPAETPPGMLSQEKIAEGIAKSVSDAKELGFDTSQFLVELDSKTTLDDLRAKVREQQWDAVSIGFGVRGQTKLTSLFEDMVNIVLEESPKPPKMMFAVAPDGLAERIKRNYPQ